MTNETNTSGGANVDGNVNTEGGDFVGRDKIINLGKSLRDEQYQIVLHWDGKTRLREFNLAGRDLSELNLVQADLRSSDLSKAELRWTKLEKADLTKANLSGADLSGAILRFAHLRSALLQGTNLSGVNLFWANLQGANLCKAVLSDAFLRRIDITGAIYDDKTKWPDGFDPEAAGAIKID